MIHPWPHVPVAPSTWAPCPRWKKGPRVRIDTLRKGDRFLSIDGATFTYERAVKYLEGQAL